METWHIIYIYIYTIAYVGPIVFDSKCKICGIYIFALSSCVFIGVCAKHKYINTAANTKLMSGPG